MDERREAHRRRLAELAAEDWRKRAAAEPEIARKEVALAEARARLRRLDDDNALLKAELDAAKPDPSDEDQPPTAEP